MKNTILTTVSKQIIKKLSLLLIAFTLLLPATVHAQTFVLESVTGVNNVIPQGQRAGVLAFRISSVGETVEISSIAFRNSTTTIGSIYGSGITEVELWLDQSSGNTDRGDGEFNSSIDQRVGTTDEFTGPTTTGKEITLFSPQTITTGNSRVFLITYNIANDATIEGTPNITLERINDQAITQQGSSITISGYRDIQVNDISPTFVIPGENFVPMLQVLVEVDGEQIRKGFELEVTNAQNNFVETENDTNGITKAYLYSVSASFDPASFDKVDPGFSPAQTLRPSDANWATDKVTFSFPDTNDLILREGVTANFLVVYEIGEDFNITDDTKIESQVTDIQATGFNSNLPIIETDDAPDPPASALVAGLSFSKHEKINLNGAFGPHVTVPILKFRLQARHTSININTITIQNNGTIPYNTSPIQNNNIPDNVRRIELYEDTNVSGGFDSANVGADTLIGAIDLLPGIRANGAVNQADRAVIPIEIDNGNGGTIPLTIPPFDTESSQGYPDNNEKLIFAVYYMGQNLVPVSNPSGNVNTQAQIENVIGTANIDNTDLAISLSGTLPAQPTATVTLTSTELAIQTLTDVSQATVVKGQTKVPMLALDLVSSANISSASFTIRNAQNSFTDQSNGVNKIWIYRDDTPTSAVLDSSITYLGDNAQLSSPGSAVVDGIPINIGTNRLFILYDIGLSSAQSMSAQLTNIVAGENDPSVTLGGEIPAPDPEATVSPTDTRLSVTSISTPASALTSTASDFQVSITVQNTSVASVRIDSIKPQFYLSSIGGRNISSEFTFTTQNATINALESQTFTFSIENNSSLEGTVIIDTEIEYDIGNGIAVIKRFKNNNDFVAAAGDNFAAIAVDRVETLYDWTLPSYISSMQYQEGFATARTFVNNDAMPAGSKLIIQLTNKGQSIDQNNMIITLNGSRLTANDITGAAFNTQAQSTSFSYNENQGQITIDNIGDANGTLTISVTDTDGIALDTANINFIVQSTLQIHTPLFFPNPFPPQSGSNLILGFQITGISSSNPGTVKVYLANHLGKVSAPFTQTFTVEGYQEINIPARSSFLKSGAYVCRIVATNQEGERSVATTKLAVY